MKQQDLGGVMSGECTPSLAAFKGRDKDKEKDSSLPFPSSVLLTRPLAITSTTEKDTEVFPSMQPKKDIHIPHTLNHHQNTNHPHHHHQNNHHGNSVSLPSLTSILNLDSYSNNKPHQYSPPSTPTSQYTHAPHRSTPPPPPSPAPVASHGSSYAGASVERSSTQAKIQEKKDILSQRDLVHQQILKHQQLQQQQSQQSQHLQQQYFQQMQQLREQQIIDQQMLEQHILEQQRHDQHMERIREQHMREQMMRDQEQQQQRELREHLREQLQQQHRRSPQASHASQAHSSHHDGGHHDYSPSYSQPSSYAHDQQDVRDYQRRGNPEAYLQPKRENTSTDRQYPEQKLTVREQWKLNILQRDPSLSESHDDQKRSRIPPRVTPLKTPSTPTTPSTPKHAGFTQHMFVVPSSPLAGASPVPVPTTPNNKHSPTSQAQFDAKFTNYTSQEFQQASRSSAPSTPSTPTTAAILANGGKWNNSWGNEKDVYKQAKMLSASLQHNVKSYQDTNSQAVPTTPTTPSTPNGSVFPPPFSRSPQPHTVPTAPSTPTASSTPRSAPRAPFTPTASGSTPSASNKRKATTDVNTIPPKVQAAPTLTPAQLEHQKESQLFAAKEIKVGLHKFNALLSNNNLLDIYNKFNRTDEYSLCHTKSHQPSSTSSSCEPVATTPTPST